MAYYLMESIEYKYYYCKTVTLLWQSMRIQLTVYEPVRSKQILNLEKILRFERYLIIKIKDYLC